MNAVPKPVRIQSKALTDSARGQVCALRWNCSSTGTVFCHVRIYAGQGTKPPDFFGYYGCQSCHREEERGAVPAQEIMRAIMETQTLMARDGLLQVKGWTP